jgi:hypothetical protein
VRLGQRVGRALGAAGGHCGRNWAIEVEFGGARGAVEEDDCGLRKVEKF